jgi:hypothetical protein
MKLKLILTTAIVGVTSAFPSVSSATPPPPPPPQLDTVTGSAEVFHPCTFPEFDCGEGVSFDAHSGPSGENPSGTVVLVVFTIGGAVVGTFDGSVTCLNVDRNRATVGTDLGPLGQFVYDVEDNGVGGQDQLGVQRVLAAPTQCPAPSSLISGAVVTDGDYIVHDAMPLPTTKDQCKNGGWHNYPQFKNQGQCIAFVNHGP